MTDPVNNKTLGGLTYNANLVKSAKKVGNNSYEIIFKTGEKITYPEQTPFKPDVLDANKYGWCRLKDENNPKAVTGESLNPDNSWIRKGETFPRNATITQNISSGLIYDDTRFDIKNVMGAKFTSSKETVTSVLLDNCSSTTVDLGANNSKWYGDAAQIRGGANNEVILDSNDRATINLKNIEGEGTAAQKDY